MSRFKTSLAPLILTFVLFGGVMQFNSAHIAYGQFFEDSETNDTNSSNSTSNSTASQNADAAEIVLLSQN
jgi:hypothetical protein